MWLCLSLSYFFDRPIRRDLASSSGVAHPAHCLTRKVVAFVSGNSQLEYVHGRHADKVEMNVRGQKGDQGQIGEVRARTRNETLRALESTVVRMRRYAL